MKTKTLYFLVLMILGTIISAQGIKKKETKFDKLTSKDGAIIKFIDYNLPTLNLKYQNPKSRIRKIIMDNKISYFHQISLEGKYDTKTASIAYDDLSNLIATFRKLKKESTMDLTLHPDYLENKYVTEDGFQLGYYVNNKELTWYAILEKYGSDNTIFFNNSDDIENTFIEAKKKIETLKK